MAIAKEELEVKFYLSDRQALEKRLREMGAHLAQGRLHEINLRFDTPNGELSRTAQVLRLRKDAAVRLTYKGAARERNGVQQRTEIELMVDDFESCRLLLEALGYQVCLIYEKFRTTYCLDGVQVTLDELPYGDFVEVEGPDANSIRLVAERLGLCWQNRILMSYAALFERVRVSLNLPFRDLTFENFRGMNITANVLGVTAAD